MFKRFLKYFSSRKRPFEGFRIEVSSYCSMECQFCPRFFFTEDWIFRNMSLETFRKISRYFQSTRWVHFQGWGEPLENPNIIEMVRAAKQADCRVGLATNGILLTEEISGQIIEEGVDLVEVSVAGSKQSIHEPLRSGSDLSQISDNVRKLVELRKRSRRKLPRVKLYETMTKLNIFDMPEMVPLAAELGVDELIAANIDYLPEERCNFIRVFYHEFPSQRFHDVIDEFHRLGKKHRLPVKTYPIKFEPVQVCEQDPLGNVFISSDGSVAPCSYLRIPKRGDIPRIFWDNRHTVPQTFFGNVNDEDLMDIWRKEPYEAFRRIFRRRKFGDSNPLEVIGKRDPADKTTTERESGPPSELPEVCQTCYKAYGI